MEKRATQVLEEEHHLIQQVVGAMGALADRVSEGQAAEREMLVNGVEFMRVFVEKCHHEKEESYLFPLLARNGVPGGLSHRGAHSQASVRSQVDPRFEGLGGVVTAGPHGKGAAPDQDPACGAWWR